MAVNIGMATFFIPRNCIDAVFPGGFEKYKEEHEGRFVEDFIWYDESIVVVHDSMGYFDGVIEKWADLGLDPNIHIGFADGRGTNCPWLTFEVHEERTNPYMVSANDNLPQFE